MLQAILLFVLSLAPQAPPQHSVALAWTASTSQGVQYNVYRSQATCACGFVRLNPSFLTATSFTDNSVIAGQGYVYQVKAYDPTQGLESAASNQFSAQVPTP